MKIRTGNRIAFIAITSLSIICMAAVGTAGFRHRQLDRQNHARHEATRIIFGSVNTLSHIS